MNEQQKQQELSRLRKELRKVSGQRASYRGDPDGLRDHQEHVDELKEKIRELER